MGMLLCRWVKFMLHHLQRLGQMSRAAVICVEFKHPPRTILSFQNRIVGVSVLKRRKAGWDQHSTLLRSDATICSFISVGKCLLGCAVQKIPTALIPMVMIVIGKPLNGSIYCVTGRGKQPHMKPQIFRGDSIAGLLIQLQKLSVSAWLVGICPHVYNHATHHPVIKFLTFPFKSNIVDLISLSAYIPRFFWSIHKFSINFSRYLVVLHLAYQMSSHLQNLMLCAKKAPASCN